jgi:hypothetical protein
MSGPLEIAREYFSEWEAIQSSTYRKLLGVSRCLQAMARKCEGRFVVLQVDAANLLGIVNRGSRKLIINELARELFWLGCLRHQVTVTVEWVPREENAFADDISKILIPEDFMLSIEFFLLMDGRWGPHTATLWTSFRRMRTTSASSFTYFTGACELRASMPSENSGRGKADG